MAVMQGLIEEASLIRALVDAAPDALLLVDAEGRIRFANGRAEEMLGRSREELGTLTIEALLPARLRDLHVAHRSAFASRPGTRPMGTGLTLRALRGDGTELPVEVSLSEVNTPQGRFVAAAMRDVSASERVRQELREAEARFRLALDEAPIGMALVGLDGRFTRVNNALCEIVGYSPEELQGLTFQAITHPEDVGRDLASAQRLNRGELPRYQSAKRYLRKDGSVVHVMLSASVVRGPDGAPLYYITQVEDITERLRAEEALRSSQEALQRAQRVAKLGSWELDLRTGRVTRSDALYALYGISPQPGDERALAWGRFVHPYDVGSWKQIEEAVKKLRPYRVELRIVLPDGEERTLLQQGEVVVENGEPVRMVGTALDITERKRAEREREETLIRLQAVLDQSPVPMILVHREHEGLGPDRATPNREAMRLVERRLTHVGQYQTLLSTPDGRPVAAPDYPSQRALRGERVEDAEYVLETAGGERVPVRAGAAPIYGVDGTLRDAVVAFLDVSAEKELERLRAEWNSIIAHDLRQPLHAIGLSAKLLAQELEDAGPRARVARIQLLTRRLNRMIEDLMDLSRLEARQLTLSRRRTDLERLVRESAEEVAQISPDRPVRVHAVGTGCEALLDPDRIAQVLENLLSNAVKYGDAGTPIDVELWCGDGPARISVTNQGPGIGPDELPHLFERFHRGEAVRRKGVRGVGLGLYITRALIEAHGGRLWVESTPGARTTFALELPRFAEDARGGWTFGSPPNPH